MFVTLIINFTTVVFVLISFYFFVIISTVVFVTNSSIIAFINVFVIKNFTLPSLLIIINISVLLIVIDITLLVRYFLLFSMLL